MVTSCGKPLAASKAIPTEKPAVWNGQKKEDKATTPPARNKECEKASGYLFVVLAMIFQYFLGGKKPETPEPEAKPQDNTNKLKKPLHVHFSSPPEKKKPTARARKKAHNRPGG